MASSSSSQDCPTCGARLEEGEDICSLCGESVSSHEQVESDATTSGHRSPTASADARIYCTKCGTAHRPDANFCSNCGAQLDEVPAVPSDPVKKDEGGTDGDKKKRAIAGEGVSPTLIGGIVGGAVLLVVALFFITAISQNSEQTADPSQNEQPPGSGQLERQETMQQQSLDLDSFVEQHEAEPLPEHIEDDAQDIRENVEELEGEERWARRGDLVNLYQGAGLIDRAAIEQREIAQASGSTSAWERAGSLMHDWMASVEGQDRALVAQLTVQAYENVLDAQPDNHDARVNLATALIDTNNPMRGVQEIQHVLEEEPEHIQARFNYAIMQAMIGRIDEAIEQFERVQELAGQDSPHYRQAEQIIAQLQAAREEGEVMPEPPNAARQESPLDSE